MNKVFVDSLPRKGSVIDWVNSIGHDVDVFFKGATYTVTIIDYDKKTSYVTIQYQNLNKTLQTSNFLNCNIGRLLGKYNKDFSFKVGHIFNDGVRDITITQREYKSNYNGKMYKYYKYICNRCKNQKWATEGNLTKGTGCAYCNGNNVLLGVNTIYDTDYWMIDLGVDKEEAKMLARSSNAKIKCICPYCKEVRYKRCSDIYNSKSIGCKCGDGFSYIFKYIYSLLKQLNLNFQTEVKYDWNKYCNPKNNKLSQASIDFVAYKDGREIPLESDGDFHRKDNTMSGQTKEQSEFIDKQRDENCLKYLGEETIRISDEGDIKENILNSKLAKEFDLSKVDWLKCMEFAVNNLVKEVCNYWNDKKEWETVKDLADMFNISYATTLTYLKNGTNLGMCYYNGKDEMINANKKRPNKKVVEVFKNDTSLGVFESCADVDRQSEKLFGIKLHKKEIAKVCRGVYKTHNGFVFKYVN